MCWNTFSGWGSRFVEGAAPAAASAKRAVSAASASGGRNWHRPRNASSSVGAACAQRPPPGEPPRALAGRRAGPPRDPEPVSARHSPPRARLGARRPHLEVGGVDEPA